MPLLLLFKMKQKFHFEDMHKNTNRAASVEFGCYQRSNYARSRPATPIASAGASLSKCSVGVF